MLSSLVVRVSNLVSMDLNSDLSSYIMAANPSVPQPWDSQQDPPRSRGPFGAMRDLTALEGQFTLLWVIAAHLSVHVATFSVSGVVKFICVLGGTVKEKQVSCNLLPCVRVY